METLQKIKSVIVDLDGTLAFKHPGRNYYDASTCYLDQINEKLIPYLKQDLEKGLVILFLTGREEKYRSACNKFIDIVQSNYKINFKNYFLWMRIDGDHRKAPTVKEELLKNFILPYYEVFYAYEDDNRNIEMFLKNGISSRKVELDGSVKLLGT